MKSLAIILSMVWCTNIEVTPIRDSIVEHLSELEDPTIVYDSRYRKIHFPCGDVPSNVGVCTDVIIRAFLKADVCLQKEVYKYRKLNGLSTDKNIDHRRVPNLCAYFEYRGWEIPAYRSGINPNYYQPGDIIWWKLGKTINHIGIVTKNGNVLHNIGFGQVADAIPYSYEIHKVYRINV